MKSDHLGRFQSKTRAGEKGCILWVGGVNNAGYGKFYLDGRLVLAHRWAYEASRGAIPDGLDLDHLCRVRNCVNPHHLEPVTRATNTRRGNGWAGVNARKTHCPQGHPYAGDNLSIGTDGARSCRTCKRDRARAYRAARKAAA